MFALVVQQQPNRADSHLRRKLVRRLSLHGSIFSGFGASGKPVAVQCDNAACRPKKLVSTMIKARPGSTSSLVQDTLFEEI
jgi:hypothetical protein